MNKKNKCICLECGGNYINHYDKLILPISYLGKIILPGVRYRKCDKCGEMLFPLKTCDALDKEVKNIIEKFIKSQPLNNFNTSKETANLLNISTDKLRKHRRIKKGFIYHIKIGNSILYLKKSVELFKKKKDGRFKINQNK